MEVLGHSQNDNTSVVNAITNQDSKLDTIATNTANIKASIEVGGDLYVSQDGVESLIGTTNTTLTDTNSKIDSMRGSHSLSDLNNSVGAVEGKVDTGNTSLASINGKITSCNTDSVIITSSALPTGASLESKQDTMITSLSAIANSVGETEGDVENVKSKLDNLNVKANDRNTKLESVKTKIDTTNTHQVDVKNKLDDVITNIGLSNGKLDNIQTQASSTNTKLNSILTSNTSRLTKQTEIKQVLDDILTAIGTLNTTLASINSNSNVAGHFGN